MIVDVDDVYLHCGKALIRADMWNPENHIERKSFPSMGHMLADQIGGYEPVELDRNVQEGYQTNLY